VPLGSTWDPTSTTSLNIFTPAEITLVKKHAARLSLKKSKRRKPKQEKKKKILDDPDPPFYGDRTFVEAVTFKHDAMIAREVASAAAEGDVGWVWEGLKVISVKLTLIGLLIVIHRRCYLPSLGRVTPTTRHISLK